MKLIIAVLVLCSYVLADTDIQNKFENGVNVRTGQQNLRLTKTSGVLTEDDQLLIEELSGLERVEGRNIVADAIHNMLNGFRPVIINGNDNFPPLCPLRISEIGPVDVSLTGVRVTATLRNVQMEGLRWYVVNQVTFNTLRLALGVSVTVPWITLTGSYDARAVILFIPHNAGGDFRVFINRFDVDVDMRLGTNILGGGSLILRELDIRLNVNDININIDGMLGSGILNDLINSFVQNAANNLIRDELGYISQTLSRVLFDTVNEFLGNFTLDDLLGN